MHPSAHSLLPLTQHLVVAETNHTLETIEVGPQASACRLPGPVDCPDVFWGFYNRTGG